MTVLQESEEFNTTIVGKQEMGSEKISTTAIREALTEGNLRKANEALGYLYRIKGTVVQGEKRGRTIGFLQLMYNRTMITCYLKRCLCREYGDRSRE